MLFRSRALAAYVTLAPGEAHRAGTVVAGVLGTDLALGELTAVARTRFADAAPRLRALPRGGFGLAHRDDADEDGQAEFYFTRLDAAGRIEHGPSRISRADGYQGPRLAAGGEVVYSAAVRSFQRNFLVGVNRFDERGVKRGGEYQVYADQSDFTRVALDVRGGRVTLLYGEDRRDRGRVLAARVVCRSTP